jgi:soluble lytic murein transglycosylase-like protein
MEMDFTKVKLNKEQQNNAFLIGSKAQEVGIDPDLALAFAWRENRFQTKGKSPKGATGIMQIMPANAKAYGYSVEDLQDPNHNIDIGLRLFKENLDMFQGNERAALVAYNANPNVAKRYLKNGEDPNVIPEETRTYLEDIHSVRPLVATGEVAQVEDDNFTPVEPLPEHLDRRANNSGRKMSY